MIVVDAPPAGSHRVLVFGAGLIGTSVIEAMRLRTPLDARFLPLDWTNPAQRAEQIAEIEREASDAASRGARLSILWSAGRTGFAATEDETAAELASYRELLAMSAGLARRFGRVAFHLISSAGGLFEGQLRIGRGAVPHPRRPYGHLKLLQERLLLEESGFASRRIYRLSSAYGPLRPNVRAGLVSTLLLSAARGEVTRLTGRMDTLRDFVFGADLGAHIADSILAAATADDIVVLASGRPCSLFEVKSIVERVIGRKLHVTFAREAANAEDITFDASALPAGWSASDVRWNIGLIYRLAIGAGIVDPTTRFGPASRVPAPPPP